MADSSWIRVLHRVIHGTLRTSLMPGCTTLLIVSIYTSPGIAFLAIARVAAGSLASHKQETVKLMVIERLVVMISVRIRTAIAHPS